ncbi:MULTISPECIES: exodeoxyribonuclease V subunit alpha [Hungatella]|nr:MULTISPECIES: exodeoxyribonuclease V subunit alpha [Hungatella]MCQ4829679.1 exodeoxyribonuclease V subunit alpha [Hungatella sp. SL.1.14]CUQ09399.1 exodeoxyribonuclease V subunit alpha [Hungatella hathewayi]
MMKEKIVKRIQKMLLQISTDSVGRSFPVNMHERKVPDEVIKFILNYHKDGE